MRRVQIRQKTWENSPEKPWKNHGKAVEKTVEHFAFLASEASFPIDSRFSLKNLDPVGCGSVQLNVRHVFLPLEIDVNCSGRVPWLHHGGTQSLQRQKLPDDGHSLCRARGPCLAAPALGPSRNHFRHSFQAVRLIGASDADVKLCRGCWRIDMD